MSNLDFDNLLEVYEHLDKEFMQHKGLVPYVTPQGIDHISTELDQEYLTANNLVDHGLKLNNLSGTTNGSYLEKNSLQPLNTEPNGNIGTNPPTVSAAEKMNKTHRNLEYHVAQIIKKKNKLRCCGIRFFLYIEEFGYFGELSEMEVHVFIRRNVPKEIDQLLNKAKLSEIFHRLVSDPELQMNYEDFDRFIHLINFRDYVFDTETQEIRNHSPEFLFTHYVDANIKPLKVVAPYMHERSSVLDCFLEDCTQGDNMKKDSLQELTGYILSNYSYAKKFFILIGAPHSGKSVWLQIWKSLIGAKYTTAVTLKQLGSNRFMTAELANSRLNISPEMNEEGGLKGVEVIKALTGGDLVSAERKGEHPFYFYGKTKIVVAGNHMPDLERLDTTSALTDRMMFILFNQSVPEERRDRELLNKLIKEKDKIVAWGIEGLLRLKRQQFIFTQSLDAEQFKAQYIAEVSIKDFIEDQCIVDLGDKNCKVHKRDLYPAYVRYSRDNRSKALKEKDFFSEVKKIGAKTEKLRISGSTPLQGFRGIKLKNT